MIQRLSLALLAGLALGVLIFLLTLSQTFDLAAHNATLESLRGLKQQDSRLNEEVLRARLLIDPDSSTLIDMLPAVQQAVDSLNQGENAIGQLGDAKLDEAYAAYQAAMGKKLEQVEQFETDNLSLAESIDTMRRAGDEVIAGLTGPKYAAVRGEILQLVKEVLEYGLLPAPENADKVANLALEMGKLAPGLPLEMQFQVVQLSTRPNAVLSQRQANEQLLGEILASPTEKALGELQAAYDAVHNARLSRAEFYRRILLGYAVVLLLGLAYLGWRLRGSYLDLNRANTKLARVNETLEMKVEERTRDLSKAYAALKASQAQVVQTEKMASLGQMVAGVAHEINTPLGYVRSNMELVRNMFGEIGQLLNQYAKTIGLIRAEKVDETQVAEAFNQLTVLEAELDPQLTLQEAGTLLSDGTRGLDQINELVVNLKNFSRLDRSRMDQFDVNQGLDGTLSIARNLLKDRIEIVKDYGQLSKIQCAPSQINQVFLNMLTNAAQAIGDKGRIKLSTRAAGDKVQISIEDNGCGMSPDVVAKIYEPFFTTKEVGKGTGLGLSIAYQIVQEHQGKIEVKSEPKRGTTFTITLPVAQQSEPGQVMAAAAAR